MGDKLSFPSVYLRKIPVNFNIFTNKKQIIHSLFLYRINMKQFELVYVIYIQLLVNMVLVLIRKNYSKVAHHC